MQTKIQTYTFCIGEKENCTSCSNLKCVSIMNRNRSGQKKAQIWWLEGNIHLLLSFASSHYFSVHRSSTLSPLTNVFLVLSSFRFKLQDSEKKVFSLPSPFLGQENSKGNIHTWRRVKVI